MKTDARCRWCGAKERLVKVPSGYQCAGLFCSARKLVVKVPQDVGRVSMGFKDWAR